MSNLKDFKNKNTEFTGEVGIDLPEGATSTRVNEQGRLRFNTETGLAEYYNGTIWKSIDAPPAVTGATPTSFASDGSTLYTIQVSGSGFDSGGNSAKFIGDDGTEYPSASVTFVSSTRVDVQTTGAMTLANGPYDIQITNTGSGLSGTGADLLTGGSAPAFTSPSASTSLGNIHNGQTALEANFTRIVAADPDGTDLQYSITSGSLPQGIDINTNDGTFTGTCTQADASAVFTFDVTISDGLNTATRQYKITQVFAPAIEVLVVGGGGGGGGGNRGNNNYSGCGGGGAGGYRTGNYALSVGAKTYTITVGGGGSGGPGGNSSATGGSNSSISAPGLTTITSAGGGYGGRETENGTSGGSGGGGGARNGEGPGAGSGGSGNSPSVSPSQGNSGGDGANEKNGGGGGGASQAGANAGGPNANGAQGGNGTDNDITGSTVAYAGGGGGGIHGPGGGNTLGPGGTGGGGTGGRHNGPQNGTAGTANLGGGGGGSGPNTTGQGSGGGGGTGVVILRLPTANYTSTTTGSPTVTTDGTDTVVKFTGSGSYNG